MDAEDWDRRYTRRPSMRKGPNPVLEEMAVRLSPGRALDLACGEGHNALWLARRGWSVTAVDFSTVAVRRGADTAAAEGLDVTFLVEDLQEWAPPAAAFDLVTLAYLQLTPDAMRQVIAGACEALAPGGTLFVIGHHTDNLTEGAGGPSTADVLYTEADLVSWCTLDAVESRRLIRPVETPDGVRDAIDALLVATR